MLRSESTINYNHKLSYIYSEIIVKSVFINLNNYFIGFWLGVKILLYIPNMLLIIHYIIIQ